MVKLANGLKILRENLELREEVARLHYDLALARADAELLAEMLCKQPAFTDWLLEQDVSSSHPSKPSLQGSKGSEVEGADDLTLALQFAGRA
jgi:hypothetical protein